MRPARRYERARNETASPDRLLVLLLEAALRQIRTAAAALEAGRPADAAEPLSKATEIVAHLDATLDRTRHPALAENLGAVYRFTCRRLVGALAAGDAALAREAERAFSPIAEAFAMAVQQQRTGDAP